MPLALTPVDPVAQQADFFNPIGAPVYPEEDRIRGDALRAARIERSLGLLSAAKALGITKDELTEAERGAYSFDLETARTLLRKGVP